METEKTDVELVREVLAGSETAFRPLLDRHLQGVHRFAYSYLKDRDVADDIAQETFVRAWKNLRKFDQERNFRTWIFAIAKNAALDHLKKKRAIRFSEIGEEEGVLDAFLAPFVDEGETSEEAYERAAAITGLARAMDELPPIYRAVLGMRSRDNLKFREIAEMLGEPVDTVKSKYRRGLALLRQAAER